MGFWHTGYMEFHESTSESGWSGPRPKPPPPVFPCAQCELAFGSAEDLAVHLFDGHASSRPVLMLRGRECGRSRLTVISETHPNDWEFFNAQSVRLNGMPSTEADARTALSATARGVVSVVLAGDRSEQEFEFSFSIANEDDLAGVDGALAELIRGRSLTITTIESFLGRSEHYRSARLYRAALANYFYGVLAREGSAESGLSDEGIVPAYAARFDDAVEVLGKFDRAPAEAICGLVAFHYNQFDLALRRTRSPRVARSSLRLASLLTGRPGETNDLGSADHASLDYVLSDTEIERVLTWCCIPLDGSAVRPVAEIEAALRAHQPSDEVKLRIIAAEHHLAARQREEGLRHIAALRHSSLAGAWAASYGERLAGAHP